MTTREKKSSQNRIPTHIAAGLSQKELAERLGLKEQQIQRYEATDMPPPVSPASAKSPAPSA